MAAKASVTSKGQITIPIEVRRDLGLKTGDQLLFIKGEDGDYKVKTKTGSIMDLRGIARWKGKPVSIKEMNDTIAKGWAGQLNIHD